MKKYETVVIIDERAVEKQENAFADEFSAFINELGGKIIETIPMGRKQFTYPIKKRKTGIYFSFKYELDPSKSRDVREKYRLNERVLRLRTFELEK